MYVRSEIHEVLYICGFLIQILKGENMPGKVFGPDGPRKNDSWSQSYDF
jgi:hypothetical protein